MIRLLRNFWARTHSTQDIHTPCPVLPLTEEELALISETVDACRIAS